MSSSSSLAPAQAAVSVEDETTKRCSACAEDRPASDYSSAQLKKKGKRVCHACVSKKDSAAAAQQEAANITAAAARKEAMKGAFATKLNSAAAETAVACPSCDKTATRLAACNRCTVECCSLRCFDQHDCDFFLEAKRTMPNVDEISEEDRIDPERCTEDFRQLLRRMYALAAKSNAVRPELHLLSGLQSLPAALQVVPRIVAAASFAGTVRVSRSTVWWSPLLAHLRLSHECIVQSVTLLGELAWGMASIFVRSGPCPRGAFFDGTLWERPSPEGTSPHLDQSRVLHKLMRAIIFYFRHVDSRALPPTLREHRHVQYDTHGVLPLRIANRQLYSLVYLTAVDRSGRATLVGLKCSEPFPFEHGAIGIAMTDLGFDQRERSVVLREGRLVEEPGLLITRSLDSRGCTSAMISALSGRSHVPSASFVTAPHTVSQYDDEELRALLALDSRLGPIIDRILDARQRGELNFATMMQSAFTADEWPTAKRPSLWVATPQRGIESELVELSLVESIVEDAAAGNAQAQLLLTHIESECSAPIAEVIAAQKSRLDQMWEDQAEQLRIHAEVVKRAELRGRIKGQTAKDGGAASSIAASSASVSSPSASAMAPLSAAASSSAVADVHSSSSAHGPAFSWTQSKEFKSVESLREPGRKKYSTIMKAAKKLLYSLRPVSVNKKGGSHLVFHFASGAPATLVQMHAGRGSKDSTAFTLRLYAQLNKIATEQFGQSQSIEGATESMLLLGDDSSRLLQ